MGYLWCRFNFWGQFCDIKFFPLYGPRYGLRNFRSIFGRRHHDHLCLNSNNSKIWRRIPEIFSEVVQKFAVYKNYAENPQNVAPFLGWAPLKTRHSTKVTMFEARCTNCVRGWCPRYGAFFRGFSVLPNRRSKIAICVYICPPEGPQRGPAWKFDPSWGPHLGVTPDIENSQRQPLRVSTYCANLMSI